MSRACSAVETRAQPFTYADGQKKWYTQNALWTTKCSEQFPPAIDMLAVHWATAQNTSLDGLDNGIFGGTCNMTGTDKLTIATELLTQSSRLFFEGAYFASLHLAGAAEELFGVYITNAGSKI
jgi:hypothetical protein